MTARPHLQRFNALCLTSLLTAAIPFSSALAQAPNAAPDNPHSSEHRHGYVPLPGLVPVENISSVAQNITASGDPAELYFPDLPPSKTAAGGFVPVILLQGARVDRQYYSQFAQELARYRFIVIVPDHTSGILGADLFTEMNVITDALAHVQAEAIDPASPLYGIVDTTRAGLTGHSFGSATALFALANFCTFPFCDPKEGFVLPDEIRAAALVAGNSGTFDLDTTGRPVALLIGDLDTGVSQSAATYETLEPPRAFIRVHGANHYGLNDIDQPPNAEVRDDETRQMIPQAITASRFAQWSGLFLRAHLYNDRRAWRRIYRSAGDAYVSVKGEPR